MVTYSFLETSEADSLLLSSLGWVVFKDSFAKDVELSIAEDLDTRKKCAVGILEGIRQEETENDTGGACEDTHEDE